MSWESKAFAWHVVTTFSGSFVPWCGQKQILDPGGRSDASCRKSQLGIGCFPRRRSPKVLSDVAEEESYGAVCPETCLSRPGAQMSEPLAGFPYSLLSSKCFPNRAMRLSSSFKEQQPIDLSHPIGNRDLRCYFGTIAYRALSTAQLSSIKRTASPMNADDNARRIHVRGKYLSNSKVVVHERRDTLIKVSPGSEKRCAWEWKHGRQQATWIGLPRWTPLLAVARGSWLLPLTDLNRLR